MRKGGKLGIEAIYRQLPTWPKYIPRLESSLLWYLGWPEIIFSFLRYKWVFHQLDSCHTETFRDQDNRYSSLGGHWVKYREIPLEDLHYRICVLHHGNMEGKKKYNNISKRNWLTTGGTWVNTVCFNMHQEKHKPLPSLWLHRYYFKECHEKKYRSNEATKLPVQVAKNLARMKSTKVTGKCHLWETLTLHTYYQHRGFVYSPHVKYLTLHQRHR